MTYIPAPTRYDSMPYRRCGNSGIKLPAISLGLWHNFGNITPFGVQQSLLRTMQMRPDLMETANITKSDAAFLKTIAQTDDNPPETV